MALTEKQYTALQERVDAVRDDPEVVRISTILKTEPTDSGAFRDALRLARRYGSAPETSAIWLLFSERSPSKDNELVAEIMEDTYLERAKRIHAAISSYVVKYWNTPLEE